MYVAHSLRNRVLQCYTADWDNGHKPVYALVSLPYLYILVARIDYKRHMSRSAYSTSTIATSRSFGVKKIHLTIVNLSCSSQVWLWGVASDAIPHAERVSQHTASIVVVRSYVGDARS